MIHVIRSHATGQQMEEMLQALEKYIKLAVDVRRGIPVIRARVAETTQQILGDS